MFLTGLDEKGQCYCDRSRNPLKSGQCFLQNKRIWRLLEVAMDLSQSPQIGSMFLTRILEKGQSVYLGCYGRNPLKSGQCFLQRVIDNWLERKREKLEVAIPSNRVNVSYLDI